MNVNPNSELRILKDCPLDASQDHTIFFTKGTAGQNAQGLADQTDYFKSLTKYTYGDRMYTRPSAGVIRVPRVADDLYDCNYIMFRNTHYGNKWFYAFITSVAYVNDGMCDVYFSIDDLQTWYFDYDLQYCVVEREHTNTDTLYSNLQPEGLNEGDMVETACYDYNLTRSGSSAYIVLGCNAEAEAGDPDQYAVQGRLVNGVYTGVKMFTYPANQTGVTQISAKLGEYAMNGAGSSIATIFMCPYNPEENIKTALRFSAPSALDGYTPRNKKLLSFPFCKLTLSNRMGTSKDYYFELFSYSSGQSHFEILLQGGFAPQAFCAPTDYLASGDSWKYDLAVPIDCTIPCTWNQNVYEEWKNTTFLSKALGSVGTAFAASAASIGTAGGVSAGVAGAAATAGLGAAAAPIALGGAAVLATGGLIKLGWDYFTKSKYPNVTHGASVGPQYSYIGDHMGFSAHVMTIRRDVAEAIDGYFDMYGYATNKLKKPNVAASSTFGRPRWCYTKLKTCEISGSLPSDAAVTIKKCFINGLTMWKYRNDMTVADYSKSNAV